MFDDSSFELPNSFLISEGDFECDGESAEIRVLKWNTLAAEKPVAFTENLRDVRLNENGQLLMFAVVAEGMDDSEIPRPDDTYLRQYLGLSEEQRPLEQDEGDQTGPVVPTTDEPFATEEPTSEVPESDEPDDN